MRRCLRDDLIFVFYFDLIKIFNAKPNKRETETRVCFWGVRKERKSSIYIATSPQIYMTYINKRFSHETKISKLYNKEKLFSFFIFILFRHIHVSKRISIRIDRYSFVSFCLRSFPFFPWSYSFLFSSRTN